MSFNAKTRSVRLRSYLTGSSLGVIASLCLGMVASAQTAPAPTPVPAEKPKTTTPAPTDAKPTEGTTDAGTVTVVGEKPAVQNKIDRDVYDVTKDPDAATGTAADILNKVPAVNVDSEGNITLRGQGVQVQLNGRSTPQLEGENRGATLQSLNADDIESIEVVSNPSAAFSGSGAPIINIVLKKNRRLGATGNVQARYGSFGRYRAGISGGSSGPKWSFNGGLNVSRNPDKSKSQTEREYISPFTGLSTYSNSSQTSQSVSENVMVRGSVEYNPTENDTFGIGVNFSNRTQENTSLEDYTGFNSNRVLVSEYDRTSTGTGESKNTSINANYEHRGKVTGEVFKVDYRHTESSNERDSRSVSVYQTPVTPNRLDHTPRNDDQMWDQLGISYVRPLENDAKLAMGADYEKREENYDTIRTSIDPVTGVETINSVYSNLFKINSVLTSAYVTYERPFGEKWSAQFGLRVEGTQFDLYSISQATKAQNSYTRLAPSLIVRRRLNPESRLTFTYTQRSNRPATDALNPFITYRDPLNVSSGNTRLRPQKQSNYDVRYDYTKDKLSYNVVLNYTEWQDLIEFVSYYIVDPTCTTTSSTCNQVLLSTRDNVGQSKRAGINFFVNYKFSPKLTVNFAPNVTHTERSNSSSFLVGQTSGTSYNATANVDYRPDLKNRFNLQYRMQGRAVEAQGTSAATSSLNLNYARPITPKLSFVISAQDILNGQKTDRTTNTLTGSSRMIREPQGQLVFISLNYSLGNRRANSNQNQGQGRGFGGGNRGGNDGSGGGGMGGGGMNNPGGGGM